MSAKSCLRPIIRLNLYLPEAAAQVKSGEKKSVMEKIKCILHKRKWKCVLTCDLIQFSKINSKSKSTVLIFDKNNWRTSWRETWFNNVVLKHFLNFLVNLNFHSIRNTIWNRLDGISVTSVNSMALEISSTNIIIVLTK